MRLFQLAFGAIALAATGAAALPASGQEIAALDRAAALGAQYGRSAADANRQAALVESRLDSTRAWRLRGGNANGSSLALNFNGTAAPGATDEERAAANSAFNTADHIAAEKQRRTQRYAVWFGGNVTVDAARASEARMATAFSDGLAFGADARLSARLLAGNAVGMAFDRVGVGSWASQRSRFVSDALYATYFTSGTSFFDALAGGSLTQFRDSFATTGWSPSRYTNRVFASMRYSRVVKRGPIEFTPYGRAAASYVMLGDYLARSASGMTCSLQPQETFAVTAGLKARSRIDTRAGLLRPHAEVAISRSRSSGYRGNVVLAAYPGETQSIDTAASSAATVSASSGVDWAINPRTSVSTVYALSASRSAERPKQTISARFTLRF